MTGIILLKELLKTTG